MAALNAKKVPKTGGKGGNFVEQEALEGSFEARVVCLLDLGLQPQRPYKGQDKPPKHEIRITYELCDEFMVDENGEEQTDKPRWFSEDIPFSSLDADLAKSTKRYKAIDPQDTNDGDFTGLIGMPCIVVLDTYESKVGGLRSKVIDVTKINPKKAAKLPELVNPPQLFLLDEPDLEVFNKQPEFIREKITSNLEFKGSLLDKMLNGEGSPEPKGKASKPAKPQEPVADEDDDEEDVW